MLAVSGYLYRSNSRMLALAIAVWYRRVTRINTDKYRLDGGTRLLLRISIFYVSLSGWSCVGPCLSLQTNQHTEIVFCLFCFVLFCVCVYVCFVCLLSFLFFFSFFFFKLSVCLFFLLLFLKHRVDLFIEIWLAFCFQCVLGLLLFSK